MKSLLTRAVVLFFLGVVAFLAWDAAYRPNQFFDHDKPAIGKKTVMKRSWTSLWLTKKPVEVEVELEHGAPKKWVSGDPEDKPYNSPGYSVRNGKKLEPMTPDLAPVYYQKPWPEKIVDGAVLVVRELKGPPPAPKSTLPKLPRGKLCVGPVWTQWYSLKGRHIGTRICVPAQYEIRYEDGITRLIADRPKIQLGDIFLNAEEARFIATETTEITVVDY